MQSNTLYYDVPRPPRLSRLLIFIKWLLILPHALILWLYGTLMSIVTFIAFFAILITGRYPADLWNIAWGYVRWNARVGVYTGLLRDEYPPFGEAPYPLDLRLERPEQQSRLQLFVRWVAIIPLALWMSLIGLWLAILMIAAFFMILIGGNISENVFAQIVAINRYALKIEVYMALLTDTWPGFSLD